jgi:hypothetical protein
MTIAKRPTVPLTEVTYNTPITEVASQMFLSYLDSTTPTVETIIDDTYTPEWTAPPDVKTQLTFSGISKTLANSWVRSGNEFSKATVSIDSDGITNLTWVCYYKNAKSTRRVRIENPFPWAVLCVVRHMDSDMETVVGTSETFVVPAAGVLETDISTLTLSNFNAGAYYLYVGVSLYDSNLSDNYITQNDDDDGFYIAFPATDANGIALGPTITLDSYNIVDKYGVAIAGLAGAMSGVEFAWSALTQAPVLQELAAAAGIGVAMLAGILVVAIYHHWLDIDDILENVIPMIGTAVTPLAAGALLNALPTKYTSAFGGLLGLGIGGAAVGGEIAAAWVLINVIDNVKLVVDA